MAHIEFLIPRRAVSLQTKNRSNLQIWKQFVNTTAQPFWNSGAPISGKDLHLTLVYLCDDDDVPVDTDNIIKPIQDALVGLVYDDDIQVVSVESHRRDYSGTFDITHMPTALLTGLGTNDECVYVRVSDALSLETYL